MNNPNFRRLKSSLIAGIVFLSSLMTLPATALPKTKGQLAQIAVPVTVKINSIAGGGSGVIIEQKEGPDGIIYTVLTANHVVENASISYQIQTFTGEELPVTSVEHLQKNQKSDPDLALVKFTSKEFYPVASLDSSNKDFGTTIFVAGFPFLDQNQNSSARDFIFSSGEINNPTSSGANGYSLLYNATTQKGMSGGPIFNEEGNLIGIHGRGERLADSEGSAKYAFNSGIPIRTFISLTSLPTTIAVNSPSPSGFLPATNPVNYLYQSNNRYAGASYFYCDLSGSVPVTVAENVVNKQKLPLIRWENDPQFKWSVTPQERCQTVSGRFQRAYYENRLNYLKIDQSKNLPVVCALNSEQDNCQNENTLITFQPNTNMQTWLDNFLNGKTEAVRGQYPLSMRGILKPIIDNNN